MAMQIFLGEPPAAIKEWFIKTYPTETEVKTKLTYGSDVLESSIVGALKASDLGILYYDWNDLVEKLEDYPDTKDDLPAVGSYLTTSYEIGDDEFVPQEWQILGYNASIPEYIKYKNGDDRVYVRSVKSGLLAAIATGDAVYTRDEANMYTDSGKTCTIGSGSFTYGNNCTWTVPDSITVDGTTYTFAGYNITLASRFVLGVKYNNKLYTYCQFDSNRNNYGQNDWSTSMLRTWMNGEGDMSRLNKQIWQTASWGDPTYGKAIKPLRVRYNDNVFADHVQNTVNRTWVHSSWKSGKTLDDNQCEHVIDRFWTLGIGNINCSGQYSGSTYFQDQNYDTSKFDGVFTSSIDIWTNNDIRKRNYMTLSGIDSGSSCCWWLRSAGTDFDYNVGYVYDYGSLNGGTTLNRGGVVPACTIS